MTHDTDLQQAFLTLLQAEQVTVSVFLVNGIKLHGVIESFDSSVLTLKGAVTQMIYKHAISTIVPSRMLNQTTNS